MATDNSSDDRGLDAGARPDVSALASAVISVLSDHSDESTQSIRTGVVGKLLTATLRNGTFNAEALMVDLQDSRVSAEQIVDIYIPQAAHELGVMWSEDVIGFAKVTIATARLQGLLTMLAPPWSARTMEHSDLVNTLMVLQASDTHTLGPHVATAQLRRLGASVRLLFGPDTQTLIGVLQQETYDLVMFSCSRTDALATIARMVRRMRSELRKTPPIALGGIVLGLTDRVKEKSGVDLVTNDVRVAFKLCDRARQNIKIAAK